MPSPPHWRGDATSLPATGHDKRSASYFSRPTPRAPFGLFPQAPHGVPAPRVGRPDDTPNFKIDFLFSSPMTGTISPVGNCIHNRPPSPSPARGRPSRGATDPQRPVAPPLRLKAYIARMVNEAPYQTATSQACEGSQCQPIARFLRCTALRSKNSAWLTSADTVDCWYGLETRNAGSGRSPVRKRSG
jgi:hypothetical protein